jgi:uncharacterized protein
MNYFKNKTILITGASSGIGKCFAKTLDSYGAKLILTARNSDELEKICSNMNDAISIPGDLTDNNFPLELYESIIKKNIKVDILINNAGFGFSGLFLNSSIDNYKEMMDLNMYSLVALSYLFLKDMANDNSGGIINISSMASFQPIPYFSIYAATKAFVTSFTLGIYEEYRESDIKIMGVCPGYTKTKFNERAQMGSPAAGGFIMNSQDVVNESLYAYKKGKMIIVNGRINRFAKIMTALLPQKLSLRLSKLIIQKALSSSK